MSIHNIYIIEKLILLLPILRVEINSALTNNAQPTAHNTTNTKYCCLNTRPILTLALNKHGEDIYMCMNGTGVFHWVCWHLCLVLTS